jgi:hypothetical protein
MELREKNAWKAFNGHAEGKLQLNRVENTIGDGMPDVIGTNCHGVGFWLELKDLTDWPARETSCPMKGKFRPGQIPFLLTWKSWGFNCYALVRIKKIFYLVNPSSDIESIPKSLFNLHIIKTGYKDIIEYLGELK